MRRIPGLLAAGLLLACTAPRPATTVRVTIPRGAGLAQAADSLAAHGVIRSPRLFRWYAWLTGRARAIKGGTYDLPLGGSPGTVLGILVRGRPAEDRLVVPEGLRLSEIAALVEAQLGIPAASFRRAAQDPKLLADFGIPATTAEGYLYPSTYQVPVGATATDLVRQMLAEFTARWQPEWTARLDTLRMSRHAIVTLASIIEGEVRYPPDRPYVSSVYHNRLARSMRLQADPTVSYALGRRRRLYEKDYQFPSPYNTYLIDGLPPTPIGQPSSASLEAALYPARTGFLYLVARPDGKHIFSRTLSEHLRAVAAVRQMSAAGRPADRPASRPGTSPRSPGR